MPAQLPVPKLAHVQQHAPKVWANNSMNVVICALPVYALGLL